MELDKTKYIVACSDRYVNCEQLSHALRAREQFNGRIFEPLGIDLAKGEVNRRLEAENKRLRERLTEIADKSNRLRMLAEEPLVVK